MDSTVNSISGPLQQYWQSFVDYLPQLIGALVVLLVGLIVASVVATVVKKLLSLAEDNKQITAFLKRWNIRVKVANFVGQFVWWLVFLVFLSAAVQILNVPVLSATIAALVAYLPAVFAAAVVAGVTFVAAHVVRGLVVNGLDGTGFRMSRAIGTAVYVVVLVFGLTLAITQLGVDTGLITANLTVIIGGVVLAFALAFGLGGRDVAARIIENAYENGQKQAERSKKGSRR